MLVLYKIKSQEEEGAKARYFFVDSDIILKESKIVCLMLSPGLVCKRYLLTEFSNHVNSNDHICGKMTLSQLKLSS